MNLHDTMKQTIQLMEDRIDDPNVEYKTYAGTEETNSPSQVTKLVAKIGSYFGGSWTRMANQYMKLEDQANKLSRARQALKDKMRDKIQNETFDPIDEAYTRAVETKDIIVQIAKATTKTKGGVMLAKNKDEMIKNLPDELISKVDFLTEDMFPELTKAIELIIAAYTPPKYKDEVKPAVSIKQTPAAKQKLKDKLAQLESIDPTQYINEEYNDDVRYQRLEGMLQKFFTRYDDKLDKISQGL